MSSADELLKDMQRLARLAEQQVVLIASLRNKLSVACAILQERGLWDEFQERLKEVEEEDD